MRGHSLTRLPLAMVLLMLISSCGGLRTSGGYDSMNNPLDSPGSQRRGADSGADLPYARGSYVEVTDENAGLFLRFPDGNAQPDLKLVIGTPLKVMGGRSSYLRVETAEGQIGFVPAIMVSNNAASGGVVVAEGEVPAVSVSGDDLQVPGTPFPASSGGGESFVAPEPEVPPISVE